MKGEDYSVTIVLADGTVRTANGFIENVWNNLVNFTNFLPVNNKTIINVRYVENIAGMAIVMKGGTRLKMSLIHRGKILK